MVNTSLQVRLLWDFVFDRKLEEEQNSVNEYSSLGWATQERGRVTPPIIIMIILVIICILYMIVMSLLYRKYRYSMEPAHVHQINYFGSFAFGLLIAFCSVIEDNMEKRDFCKFYYVTLAGYIMLNMDMMVMQMDRIFALYWACSYKTYVTVKGSTILLVLTKVISFFAAFVVFLIDKDYGICAFPREAVFKRRSHIVINSYPKVVVVVTIFLVSAYMVKIKTGKSNKIHINLPTQTEERPNMNIIQSGNDSGSNNQNNGGESMNFGDVIELINEGSSTNVNGNRSKQNPDQESPVTENDRSSTGHPEKKALTGTKNKAIYTVERKNDQPNEFFKVLKPETADATAGSISFNINVFLLAKSALQMNCYLLPPH